VSTDRATRRFRLAAEKSGKGKEKPVGATEDLMREHGVIRRALLVYRESAVKLRSAPGSVDPKAIAATATLFRSFGEDYHERKLEETYIFPAVKKAGGPAAAYVDVLIAQHNRPADKGVRLDHVLVEWVKSA
jgi:hemerythrin-like domain-containing protein